MKKHILFVITNFRHGGTNKSLENLLTLLDTNKYEIDVFAMEHYGPYSSMLPNCRVLAKDQWLHALISQYADTAGVTKIRSMLVKLLRKFFSLLKYNFTDNLYKNSVHHISRNKTYNTVIAFSEGAPTAFVKHFNSKNKLAWIHCDYSSYLQLNNYPDERLVYKSYNSIVCVSEFTKGNFIINIPELEDKVLSVHNLLNSSAIKELSEQKITDEIFKDNKFLIISIGRFYFIKRLSLIPDIAKKLREFGCDFKWYVIGGDGNIEEKKAFNQKIGDFELNEMVFALGEKDNPYPYIKNSDLLVSTSLTEACPYVINEAKVLHIPIVSADYGSAHEFIEDDVNGMIAPIDQIAEKIALLINKKSEYKRIKDNISNFEYKNKELLFKIENILSI